MTDLSRRSLLLGVGALIAAPAIVRAASLMPVRAIVPVRLTLNQITREWVSLYSTLYSSIGDIERQWWDEDDSNNFIAKRMIRAQLSIRLPPTMTGATPEWIAQAYPIVHA